MCGFGRLQVQLCKQVHYVLLSVGLLGIIVKRQVCRIRRRFATEINLEFRGGWKVIVPFCVGVVSSASEAEIPCVVTSCGV